MPNTCNDCGCNEGQLHELFCLRERCPFCGGQLVVCGCMSSVLKLSPDEQRVVDEYIDDSVEPLLGINERWVSALNRKGRVPF